MKAHGHRSSGRETKRQTSQSDSVKSFSSVERGGEADTKRSSSRKEKKKEERLSGKRSDSGRRQKETKRHASTASGIIKTLLLRLTSLSSLVLNRVLASCL